MIRLSANRGLGRLCTVAVIATSILGVGLVDASGPGVGLGSHSGVLIQEYWMGGRPYYAIANCNDDSIRIGVRECSIHGGRVKQGDDRLIVKTPDVERYGPVIHEWPVGPRAVEFVEVSDIDTMQYVSVLRDGESIGLLLPMKGGGPRVDDASIVATNACVSYWGGISEEFVYIEQQSKVLRAGRKVRLRLFIRSQSGEVGFGPYPALWSFANPDGNPGSFKYDLPIPLALPTRVKSSTLEVDRSGQLWSFDSNVSSGEQFHEVVLEFDLPVVDVSTPMLISGFWRKGPGSSCWITRMIVVEP